MPTPTVTFGQRGTIVIPKSIRDRIGWDEGAMVAIEVTEQGILLRPVIAEPVDVERYTIWRRAEFLLNNAVGDDEYHAARAEVESMGIDPDKVLHEKPLGA